MAWLIAGALAVALIALAIWWRTANSARQTMQFYAPMPCAAQDIAVAPNGHTIAVVAYLESVRKNALWIYELGSPDARSLLGTEGATYPFWSPDSRFLAFFADGKVKKLDVSGGPVQIICDAPSGRGGTWNKDGVIVLNPEAELGNGLYRVAASGGALTPITKPDVGRGEQSHRWPQFLPDGRHYLYTAAAFSGQKGANAIFVGSLDSNERRFVVEAPANAAYAAPGYLLFPRERTLLAQRFDLKRFTLTGEPTAVVADLQYRPQVRRAVFAVSDNGLLVAQTGSGVALSQPVWFDRKGKKWGEVGKVDAYSNISLAQNGRFVAVDKVDMGSLNTDIWTYDLQRESAKRLTFAPATSSTPIWSPDASRLLFSSNRKIHLDLYMKNSDGAREEESIVHGDFESIPSDWSRDGRYILYTQGKDLWVLTPQDMRSSLFLKASSALKNGQFSPDGKWVAYASNETGKWEIYVTSFPDAKGRWQVSSSGGEQPRWRGDGKELFFLSSDSKMIAVPVTTGTNFDPGTPVALFQAAPRQPVPLTDRFVYDVSQDGQRFLINTQVKEGEAPMSVILNWDAKLNK